MGMESTRMETPQLDAVLTGFAGSPPGLLISVIRLPSVSTSFLPPHIAKYESFLLKYWVH
ncbi:hypothetical protein HER14_01170 [Acidithiobacillus thiooxidans]|jgi:hypothetical protein|uniref:hypothetical protein n=1 Tax=Acidithiobacillus thiooxidans TaxID=930 RepID=UPI001C0784A5|nr:hypothetical protein [Acidithiobacillus thiooxidans]MBU2749618.1 hypothetical protein [Acidithiobacillus thiooxidans]